MKITVDLDYDLEELKEACIKYYGETGKIRKTDVVSFLSSLLNADLMDILNDEDLGDD